MQYEQLCKDVLDRVGGKDNVSQAFHCITRLRIIVKDRSKVDFDHLDGIEGVIRVMDSQGQIQFVIGTHVNEVYEEFCEYAGVAQQDAVDADPEDLKAEMKAKGQNFGIISRLLDTLAAIVTPALWAIVCGGMIKGVVSTLTAFSILPSDSDIVTVLNILGDAPFYFMPFLIGYTSAKRFKINESFGLMIAGALLYPDIISPAEGVTGYHFLFFDVPATSYKGQIFPIILSVFVFAIVFKFINKYIPKNVRIVFSAALTFIITGPLILGFVAPLSFYATNTVVNGVQWLFHVSGPLAGAVFCGIIPLTIIFGIKGWSVIELQNLETLGYDYMLPMFWYSNVAVAGATIAASFKFHGNKRAGAFSTGCLGILGVTEPALYGYSVPAKYPLAACMIGGAAGGAVAMLLNVHTYAFSMPGITSIATYLDGTSNFLMMVITCVVAFAVSFGVSFVLTPKDDPEGGKQKTHAAVKELMG